MRSVKFLETVQTGYSLFLNSIIMGFRERSSLGRPDFCFKYYLKTEILTLENVTCRLLLLKRPITSQKGVLVMYRMLPSARTLHGHFSLTL